MILLLGATGYIGQAFATELRRRGACFIPLSRQAFDYTRFDLLFDYIRRIRPSLVINAAGHSKPGASANERERMLTFHANTLLPQTIARACVMTNTRFGHVSSSCIFSGAKIFENGMLRVENDLGAPAVRSLFEANPERFFGFTELDEPNFSFRSNSCNFLSGTKALAEESLQAGERTWIWRASTAFDYRNIPCNMLCRLLNSHHVEPHISSFSHVEDFVAACLDLVDREAPFGTYNINNPGAFTTGQILNLAERLLPRFSKPESLNANVTQAENGSRPRASAKQPGSSCILDTTKLLRAGVRIRPLGEALEHALTHYEAKEFVPRVMPSPEREAMPTA